MMVCAHQQLYVIAGEVQELLADVKEFRQAKSAA